MPERNEKSSAGHRAVGEEVLHKCAMISCKTIAPDILPVDQSVEKTMPVSISGQRNGNYHVYLLGYFEGGGVSYLVVRPGGNILIDPSQPDDELVDKVKALGKISHLVFTHRNYTVYHKLWKQRLGDETQSVLYVNCVTTKEKREHLYPDDIEIIIAGQQSQFLDQKKDVELIPIRNSLMILIDNYYLFTGDALAFSREMGHLYSIRLQCSECNFPDHIQSLKSLLSYDWLYVLPGHGASFEFASAASAKLSLRQGLEWMESQPSGFNPLWSLYKYVQMHTHQPFLKKALHTLLAPLATPTPQTGAAFQKKDLYYNILRLVLLLYLLRGLRKGWRRLQLFLQNSDTVIGRYLRGGKPLRCRLPYGSLLLRNRIGR